MDKLISVIVPVYNVEKYLDKCVESIVNQTYKNLEIILVDDGSPDGCPAMCDKWAERDGRIKVIHKENGGLSSARNAGMKVMEGEYVGFIDSDDYIDCNMLEKMLGAAVDNNCDVCVCNANLVDENGGFIERTEAGFLVIENDELMKAFLDSGVFNSQSVCNKLYRTDIIKDCSLCFDEENHWGEDYPFNYYYLKNAKSLVSVEDAFYYYTQNHKGSITYGITYGRACRWRNVRIFVEGERGNAETYPVALKKYASELLVCCRELLRSNDKELIDECYPLIVDEINEYYEEFKNNCELSKASRASVELIHRNPELFKKIYKMYKNLGGGYKCLL